MSQNKKQLSGLEAFRRVGAIDRRYLAEADALIGLSEEENTMKHKTRRSPSFLQSGWFAAAASALVALGAVAFIVRAGQAAPAAGPDSGPTKGPSVASRVIAEADTLPETLPYETQPDETAASLDAGDDMPAAEAETDEWTLRAEQQESARAESKRRAEEEQRKADYIRASEQASGIVNEFAAIHTCVWEGNGGTCRVCGRVDPVDPAYLPANHEKTEEEAAFCAIVAQYLTDLHVTFDRVEYTELGLAVIVKDPGWGGYNGFLYNILPDRVSAVMHSGALPLNCPSFFVMYEGELGHLCPWGTYSVSYLSTQLRLHPNTLLEDESAVAPVLCTLTDAELTEAASAVLDAEGWTVRGATLPDAQWLDVDLLITEDTVVSDADMMHRMEKLCHTLDDVFQMVTVRVYLPGAGIDDYAGAFEIDFVNRHMSYGGRDTDRFIDDYTPVD